MKKVLALAFVLAFAMVAHAGPYFVAEMDPFDLSSTLDVGWDGGLVGEGIVLRWDIQGRFVQSESLTFGADLSIDGPILGLDIDTELNYDISDWPDVLPFPDSWWISAKVSVNLSSVATMWLGGVLEYASPWVLAPIIGLECRW